MTSIEEDNSACQHPIAAMLSRFHDFQPYFEVGFGPPPDAEGWITGAQLLGSESEPHLRHLLAQVGERFRTADCAVMASFFFSDYTWQLIAAGIAGYMIEQRVPDLSATNIACRFNEEGEVAGLRLLVGRFATPTSDPTAGHPDAYSVSDTGGLLHYLQERLIDGHLTTLIERLSMFTPLKQPALWTAVADRSAGLAIWLSKLLGRVDTCEQDLALLLGILPRKSRVGILSVEYSGRREIFPRRVGCCLAYRLPDGKHCSTCSLLTIEERVKRLSEYMASGEVD